MININKVFIQGNLGNDPEVKYLNSGDAVANFSIATNQRWKDKTTGEINQRTEWHRVVAFKRLAEIAGEYLKKGQPIYVEGNLRTRSWDDSSTGKKMYITEIVAREIQMGGKKGDAGSDGQQSNQAPPVSDDNNDNTDFDDDIPF